MIRTDFEKRVYTPLGQGKIVYELPDGTLVVEFEHGGGHIFLAEELFPGRIGDAVYDLRSQSCDEGSDGQVRRRPLS